jgi:hypothetical protein
MPSLPAPSPPANASRPRITGRLVTGEPGLADLFNEAAVLTIRGPAGESLYWCGVLADAGRIVGLTLRKIATGQLHRITFDGLTWECDCADCCYRQRDCNHPLALHDALTHRGE